MEPTHEIHVPTSAVLDNSHYDSETLVSTNAPTVQPTFALINRPHASNSPVPPFTPSTRGRLLNEDFVDFRYGDIHASAAQITTRRITIEHSPEQPPLPPPSQETASQDQLLHLRSQYDAAELMAKTAEAEARTARARRTTQQLDLETRAQARRSNSSSPRVFSPTTSPRAGSPQTPSQQGTDLGAVLLHLETQRRNDSFQREEERRLEQIYREEERRREQRERDEDRRADRQAAEERAARTEAHHQAQLAALVAASHPARSAMGSYVVGRALASTATFTGDGTTDCGTYLRALERLFKAHGIPVSHWPNELFIKLTEQAKGWYEQTFPDPDTFPTWSQLTSGLLSRFGPRYAAADAWASKCSATRQEGESGLAALQRLDELQQTLLLLGVPAQIGPIEQQCYHLQRLLSVEEKRVWSAAANALPFVSDEAIRLREATAAANALTSTGRQSMSSPVPVDERDAWFEPRLAHLLTFLKDQPGHPTGAGRRQPARAAAISESTSDAVTPAQLLPAAPQEPPTPQASAADRDWSGEEARCVVLRKNRDIAAKRADNPVQPPAYEGPGLAHGTANQAEFIKRKACGACYHCPMKGPWKVNYAVLHTQCPTHGRSSTLADRHDPTKRVNGSGSTF